MILLADTQADLGIAVRICPKARCRMASQYDLCQTKVELNGHEKNEDPDQPVSSRAGFSLFDCGIIVWFIAKFVFRQLTYWFTFIVANGVV